MTAALFHSFDSINSLGEIVNHPVFDTLPRMDTLEAADATGTTTAAGDSAITATPKPDRKRSTSESQQFVDSMRAIFSNKKPALAAGVGAAVKPYALPSTTTLESLEELNSRSWNNLGPHQEVIDVDVANIFSTQQEVSVPAVPMTVASQVPALGPLSHPPAASRAKERSTVQSSTSLTEQDRIQPTDKDVLLGRGGRSGNHPGNKRYLALKDTMQAEYFVAEKNDKKVISQKLVDIVNKEWKGRFLKLNNGQWVEVSNEKARQKASQALRELNTPEQRAKKRARYAK
jgi:hypothetical protein